jgi:hypothetical protein
VGPLNVREPKSILSYLLLSLDTVWRVWIPALQYRRSQVPRKSVGLYNEAVRFYAMNINTTKDHAALRTNVSEAKVYLSLANKDIYIDCY